MPSVAPVWGLLTPPWGLNFIKVARLAHRDLELIYDESLLPAPAGCGELWQHRAVSTSEAGSWLRSLLSKRLGEIDYTTIHTLKSTPWSWCAKAGLSEPTRLMLGHHVTGKHSADVYARDVLAAPLREFDAVLQQIRNGACSQPHHRKIQRTPSPLRRREPLKTLISPALPPKVTQVQMNPIQPWSSQMIQWLTASSGTLTSTCSSTKRAKSCMSGQSGASRGPSVAVSNKPKTLNKSNQWTFWFSASAKGAQLRNL